MENHSRVIGVLVLLASSLMSFAIEGLHISVQSSNAVLSWPSTNGETYIVQYRQTVNTADSWQTLTSSLPATSGTNWTFFVHSNAVQYPNYRGTLASMASSGKTLAAAKPVSLAPLAIATNGTGGAVPLALFPPGVDLSGYVILNPITGESVNGAEYSVSSLVLNKSQFESLQLLNDGAGGEGTGSAPETGFYRVARNGVHIYGLTNGMVLSGSVSIPLEMALDSTNEIAGVTFYDGGAPLIGASAQTNAGGGWILDWNTSMTFNGNHAINAEVDFVTDNLATNVPVTVTVSNVISFPNYFSRIFGNGMWLYAQTVPNAAYEIDMYDENTNFLGYFSDYTDGNGIISFIWDLTDGGGHTFDSTNFYGVFMVDTSLLNIQQRVQTKGADTPGFQKLALAPTAPSGVIRANAGDMLSSATQI